MTHEEALTKDAQYSDAIRRQEHGNAQASHIQEITNWLFGISSFAPPRQFLNEWVLVPAAEEISPGLSISILALAETGSTTNIWRVVNSVLNPLANKYRASAMNAQNDAIRRLNELQPKVLTVVPPETVAGAQRLAGVGG